MLITKQRFEMIYAHSYWTHNVHLSRFLIYTCSDIFLHCQDFVKVCIKCAMGMCTNKDSHS
jgi:hypothetical protein